MGPVKLLSGAMLCAMLATAGCRSSSPPAEAAPDAQVAAPPAQLRVAPERVSQIQLSRAGAPAITLSKQDDAWKMTAPITYPANAAAVETILATLADLEVTSVAAGDDRKHGLGPDTAIVVKAWEGERLASQFVVGHASREQTHVRALGNPQSLTVRGRCRQAFDRTADELRDPVITDFNVRDVEGVTYDNASGRLELAASGAGGFVAKGEPIRNFDAERAAQGVAVLAQLRAKGFADAANGGMDASAFLKGAATATVRLRSPQGLRTVELRIGTRTPDRRLYLQTSDGPQVYLVSAHLESSLVPARSQFERTDETMRRLKELAEQRAQREKADAAVHTHSRPAEMPSVVPPEMMKQLREFGASQRQP